MGRRGVRIISSLFYKWTLVFAPGCILSQFVPLSHLGRSERGDYWNSLIGGLALGRPPTLSLDVTCVIEVNAN
jgi:hypothetical protein